MDIEELSKSQIILLTLFTSFVTSIATGIVTVSLLSEAPEPVVRTINRIVERTVEQVVPSGGGEGTATVQKTETTVVVKEEDLIANSISNAEKSMVRIYTVPEQNQTGETAASGQIARTFRGIGIVVSPAGLVMTPDGVLTPGRRYQVRTVGGNYYEAAIVVEGKDRYGVLRITASNGELPALQPAKLADLNKMRLGQTVVMLYGEDGTKVDTGVLGEIVRTSGDGKTEGPITSLKTSIPSKPTLGSPLISAFGEVIGLGTNDAFIPLTESKIAALTTPSAATSTSSQN